MRIKGPLPKTKSEKWKAKSEKQKVKSKKWKKQGTPIFLIFQQKWDCTYA
jgi:hypothetical protein